MTAPAGAPGPLTLADYAERARTRTAPGVWDFIAGGAGDERTLAANTAAFDRIRLRPRVLAGAGRPRPGTRVLGREWAVPVGIAPMGYHTLVHPDGEVATAAAAGAAGVPLVVSTFAGRTFEDVAAATGAPLWLQVYCFRDRGTTRALIERAERAGVEALVLTADAPRLGRRLRDLRGGFRLPPGIVPANLSGTGYASPADHARAAFDPELDWTVLSWLRSVSTLPVLVKGVLAAADARRAVDAGAAGIVVSNHGGRQLDGAPAALEALPEVAAAAAGRVPVLLDGGVRRGVDVLAALALGADAVFLGRPVLHGLAVAGRDGVADVLGIVAEELDEAMALTGLASAAAAGPDLLAGEARCDPPSQRDRHGPDLLAGEARRNLPSQRDRHGPDLLAGEARRNLPSQRDRHGPDLLAGEPPRHRPFPPPTTAPPAAAAAPTPAPAPAPAPAPDVDVVLAREDLHGSVSDPLLDTMNFLNEITHRYPRAVSFAPGRPYDGFFDPESVLGHIRRYTQHLEKAGRPPEWIRDALFQYGPTGGLIRDLVAESLRLDEQIDVPPEAIVVTVGCQEAMLLALRALIAGPDDVLLVSSPCYVGITGAARLLDIETVPVEEGPDGFHCARLEAALAAQRARGRRPRAFYVVPDHSNPSGATMTPDQRRELLRLAAREDFLVLEDSPYRLVSPGPQQPTLKALDRRRRVVQLGSFAKSLFPGARVGYVVADQPVVDRAGGTGLLADELIRIKSMVTVNTSALSQAAVAGLLLSAGGGAAALNTGAAAHYGAAMRATLEQLDICLPEPDRTALGVRWNRPGGGFFLTVTVPFAADNAALARSAEEFGVIWTPMSYFYPQGGGEHVLRLSVSCLTQADIRAGIARLARFITAAARD